MFRSKRPKAAPARRNPSIPQGTLALVDVKQIIQSCVVRANGTVAAWVEVDGINFDLLHPGEQDMILLAYQAALHTILTPIQIVLMPEPIDLRDEVDRLRRPTGDPLLDAVGQDFAALVARYTSNLERITYLIVVPGASVAEARERAQTFMGALADVHPDLRPGFVDTNRIIALLSLAYGVPVPGPAHTYFPMVDRIWGTAPDAEKGAS